MDRLPGETSRDGVDLRRWIPADAPVLHELISRNVEHLRPRMPWIAVEPQTVVERRQLIEKWDREWVAGGDVVFAIRRDRVALGACGLQRRLGPHGLEIGYWVDAVHQGQGIATSAAAALTSLAFTVPDIDRVEIHHAVFRPQRVAVQFHLPGFATHHSCPRLIPCRQIAVSLLDCNRAPVTRTACFTSYASPRLAVAFALADR